MRHLNIFKWKYACTYVWVAKHTLAFDSASLTINTLLTWGKALEIEKAVQAGKLVFSSK